MTETETQCLKTLWGWNQPISLFHRDEHKTQEGETAYSGPDGWPGGNEIQVLLEERVARQHSRVIYRPLTQATQAE